MDKKVTDNFDLAVIGAGASGLMAAAAASAKGLKVALLEKNSEAAKKIYATGSGRCNFLNADADASFYSSNSDSDAYAFAEAVMEAAGPDRLLEVFSDAGVLAAEEDEGRMYPRSGQASAIASALIRMAEGATLFTGFEVKTAARKTEGFGIEAADGRVVNARKLLIACGGKAGIQYGSDGRGYKLAECFGHKVNKPIPALTALIPEEDISALAGVRASAFVNFLKNDNGKDQLLAMNEYGEVQFTKDAVSGICVMNQSRFVRLSEGCAYKLLLDFMWDYERDELEEMLREREALLGKDKLLQSMVPDRLADYILNGSKDIKETAKRLKGLAFTIVNTKGWPNAQVTAGGIDISEIDPETMESRLVPGLYFAGEVIDIDGPCGGFNLTWAFATGLIAGENA